MGLTVYVYRDRFGRADHTNHGISATVEQLWVANVTGQWDEPPADIPATLLVPGPLGTPILVPASPIPTGWEPSRHDGHVGPMAGGNLADNVDSRWRDAVRRLAIGELARRLGGRISRRDLATFDLVIPTAVAIHDRFETTALYAQLST
jgi:hypothetical protein